MYSFTAVKYIATYIPRACLRNVYIQNMIWCSKKLHVHWFLLSTTKDLNKL